MKKVKFKHILVPVDFGTSSLNALQAAVAMAKLDNATLHLLHVTDTDYDLYRSDHSVEKPLLPESIGQLMDLAKSIVETNEISCNHSSLCGNVTYTIIKTAIELEADLVVMGKNGTADILDDYAGTHTCQVVKKSRIPVLVVPGNTTQYHFCRILFPLRPLISVPFKYDAIRPIVLKNAPEITLLGLRNPDCETELHIISRLSTMMRLKLRDDGLVFKEQYYFRDNRFAEHIISLTNKNSFDLVVVTSEVTPEEKYFHLSYFIRKMIHECSIPVLIIYPPFPKISKEELLGRIEKEMVL
ncbi:MAG: universal stress protein [Sediminibacterium sp.]